MIKSGSSYNRQSGISLLEILLSVGLTAIVIIGATRIAQDWAERARNREEATYMASVSQAAKSYVSANFSALMIRGFAENMGDTNGDGEYTNADLVNRGRALMIPMTATGTDFRLRDGAAGLPLNFPITSPMGREIRVYVRNLGYIGAQRMLEIITVATSAGGGTDRRFMSRETARDIAQSIGPEAGIYTENTSCDATIIQSIYGSWQLENRFLNSGSFLMPGVTGYCPVATTTGRNNTPDAYVVVLDRTSFGSQQVSSELLYRVAVPDNPVLNRMETNIDMGRNAITNAGAVSVDSMQVIGDMQVSSTTSDTAVYVDEAMRVAGNASYVRGRQETGPSGTPRVVSGGNVVIDGPAASLGTHTLGSMSASSLNGANAVVSARRNLAVNSTMTVGGNMAVNDELNVSNRMTSGQMVSDNTEGLWTYEVYPDGSASGSKAQVTANTMDVANNTAVGRLRTEELTVAVLDMQAPESWDTDGDGYGDWGTTPESRGHISANQIDIIGSVQFSKGLEFYNGMSADQLHMVNLGGCTATVMNDRQTGKKIKTAPYDCKKGPKKIDVK